MFGRVFSVPIRMFDDQAAKAYTGRRPTRLATRRRRQIVEHWSSRLCCRYTADIGELFLHLSLVRPLLL